MYTLKLKNYRDDLTRVISDLEKTRNLCQRHLGYVPKIICLGPKPIWEDQNMELEFKNESDLVMFYLSCTTPGYWGRSGYSARPKEKVKIANRIRTLESRVK